MAFCSQCGAKAEEGAKFCEVCGAPLDVDTGDQKQSQEQKQANSSAVVPKEQPRQQSNTGKNDFGSRFGKFFAYTDTTSSYQPADIDQNRLVALLSYLGIVVLVPMLAVKESPFTQYHVKLGLNLLLWSLISNAASMVFGWIPIIGNVVQVLLWIVNAALFGVSIFGIVSAAQGKARELEILKSLKLIH